MDSLTELKQLVVDGDMEGTEAKVRQALAEGLPGEQILSAGLIAGMAEIGQQFETGECFVPEMLLAARAMQGGLEILRPALVAANVRATGKIVVGTVSGDLHDIGKNLVIMMFEGAGFEVVDLGIDVKPDAFVQAVREHQPQLLGLSALLTTTMINLKVTIEALQAAGVRDHVKVLIGGAPVTEAYAQKIGADGFAPDASRAVTVGKALLGL